VSALIGPRVTSIAPFDQTYSHVLSAYGYGSLSPQFEVSLNGGYSLARFLDVGVHAGYLLGSGGSNSGLFLNELELGGFAAAMFWRGNPTWAGGMGVGVEGGIEAPFLTLHGYTTSERTSYVGPIIFARLGDDRRVQPTIHLRYLASDWGSAIGGFGLPLGGLSITVGGNLSL
jgi:hypothetical protein